VFFFSDQKIPTNHLLCTQLYIACVKVHKELWWFWRIM